MCGFSRRFDSSYRDAWSKVDAGAIGRPVVVRSQTCDKHDPSDFFVKYAQWSGGVFVDMAVRLLHTQQGNKPLERSWN